MARQRSSQIVGVFEDQTQADRAIAALRRAGFGDGQIGVIYRDLEGRSATGADAGTGDVASDTGTAALTGMLTGAGLGALAGLGVLAGVIPVIGPAIAAGSLGVILSNAAAGAGLAGLTGALVGAGLSEDEAATYQQDFEAGRVLVTVEADGRGTEALSILRSHGARTTEGDSLGEPMQAGASMTGQGSGRTARSDDAGIDLASAAGTGEGRTMELREERLHAHTRPVEVGEVEIRKEVVTEHKTIDVPIEREEVVIERRPASGHASSADIAAGSEAIRIPVREEKVMVEKEAVVTEEVTVGKKVVQGTERVAGDVRKEKLVVDEEGEVHTRDASGSKPPRKP